MKEVTNPFNLHILTATSIDTQFEFLKRHYRRIDANILVVRCGNGYKSTFFEEQGYTVTSIDDSKENVVLFKDNTSKDCIVAPYTTYKADTPFDIIWVDDAFTYEKRSSIIEYLEHFKTLLKPNGYIYCCFKFGDDYYVNGTIYTSFTLLSFNEFIESTDYRIADCLVTKDERPNREQGWLHILLQTK